MSTVPLCVHHSLEGEHVHALRSCERGCFLVVQTLWAEKIQSTTDAGSLNTFGRNEIEAALISSALLRIACLVILYKTSYQELAADGCNRTGMRTRARLLKQNENRRDGAATGPWSYLVVRSCGSGRARPPRSSIMIRVSTDSRLGTRTGTWHRNQNQNQLGSYLPSRWR